MKKYLLVSFAFLTTFGCSTSQPRIGVQNAGKEVTVATLNDESKPSWVKKAAEQTFYVDDGQVISIGSTTLSGDSRIDAGFKIAEASARANIGRVITNRMESLIHVAEESADFQGIKLQSITAEATKLTASGMKPSRRFYERVAVTGDDGVPRTELRFWSELKMSQDDYAKAVVQTAKNAESKSGLSPEFSKQVEKHFERFTEADSQASSLDHRTPASDPKSEKQE